jgi:hypothetical protein
MNNRIKELIKESGGHWNYGDFNMPSSVEFQEDEIEKFAQLIILECMDVFGRDLPEPGIDGRMTDVIDRICNVAEHFGVES